MVQVWITQSNTDKNQILRIVDDKKINRWVYFGRNYFNLSNYNGILRGIRQIPTSQFLYETAKKIKQEYIQWIADMGKPYGASLHWWTSIIAEKNTMGSDLFLNICCLETIEQIIKENKDNNILIITEEWTLGLTLHNNLLKLGCVSYLIGTTLKWQFSGWLKEILDFGISLVVGLFRLFQQYRSAQQTRHLQRPFALNANRPCVCLHTCIDDACLGKDGTFRDRYFTVLPAWLKEQGFNVITIVWPYNVQRNLSDFFEWFRAKDNQYIIPEDYFRFMDYPKAFLSIIAQMAIARQIKVFRGKEIHLLLLKVRLNQASKVEKIRFLLYEKMIERLKEENVRLDYYVDTFENMFVEKPAAKAVHQYYPDAQVVGMQHVPFDPLLLLYSVGMHEITGCPTVFPDVIACCGRQFVNILTQNGFPPDLLRLGPALRYLHLQPDQKSNDLREINRDNILVVLPIELDVAVEVLIKVVAALAELQCKVAIRPHPMTDKTQLLSLLGMKQLPEFMDWADKGDMKMWLSRAVCVLGSATAAVFEAVMSEIPVVILGREVGLEMNPLSWWQDDEPMFQALYDPVQIRKAVTTWIGLSHDARSKRMQAAHALIGDCFRGWDEAFFKGLFKIAG